MGIGAKFVLVSNSGKKKQEKKVLERYPYYSFVTVEKDQFAPGMPEQPIRVLAVAIGVFIHKDIPEAVAYKLTKAVIEDNSTQGEQVQAASYPALKGEDLTRLTAQFALTPLHQGAVKFYRESGTQIKPELIPPELR